MMVEFIKVYKFNLKDINFKVEKGEFVVVRGKGGSGKTTLLKLAFGELLPDEGTVKVFDQPIVKIRASTKKKIGVIPQECSLLEDKDVLANLEIPLKLLGEYDRRAVLSILDKLGLYEYHKIKTCELSRSYRQLLKIAIPIAKNPFLLLVDEPLQNLDPEQENIVLSLFKDINTTGMTILFATSQLTPPYFTRELYISDGEIKND